MIGCKFLISNCVAVSVALGSILAGASALYAQPTGQGLNIPTHCIVGTESYRAPLMGVQTFDISIVGIHDVPRVAAGPESYRSRYTTVDTYSVSLSGIKSEFSLHIGVDSYGVQVTNRESYRQPRLSGDTYGTNVCGVDAPCK